MNECFYRKEGKELLFSSIKLEWQLQLPSSNPLTNRDVLAKDWLISGFNKLWFADFPNCTITLRGGSVPALEMKLVKKI